MDTAVFSLEQIAALSAPLDRAKVQTRSQAGRSLAYLEGWQAIAEANRIFGFDGWQRETIAVQCVSERERTLGSSNRAGWGVTYTARVRISVGEVIREGSGAGQRASGPLRRGERQRHRVIPMNSRRNISPDQPVASQRRAQRRAHA
jgi:recombination DNA repair RAD52 pathway protein